VWQWRRHGAALDDGRIVDAALIRQVIAEELQTIRAEVGDARFESGRFELARDLFAQLVLAEELADFLTVGAYAHLD
jgi:malate synthase